MKTPIRWKRWLLGSLLAAVLLGGGYYVARHQAWPAVKSWRLDRMNRDAQAFLDAGDPANALLTARKSLQSTTQNPTAWRIAVAATVARQNPEAVWYQDNLCREQPTRENRLELLRLALRFEVATFALSTIKAMEGEADADPEFHRLAAEVYRRLGQPEPARLHLVALARLQPDDPVAQLDLAEIELAADAKGADRALRARVLALTARPDLRARALPMLLRDNVARKVKAGTDELVQQMQLIPDLDIAGRLLVIEAQFLLGQPAAAERLAQLQAEVADQPPEVARVLDFYIRTGRTELAQTWTATLPAPTRGDEDVQRLVAESLLLRKDAAGLEAYLRGGHWPKRDYLRAALLAWAYRDLGKSAEFSEAWKLALISGGGDLRKATALLARVDAWRWVKERHEVVWKLFALVPTNESVQRILTLWERHQGNTVNLHRIFSRIVEVQPGDEVARNNLAYTSLLLDVNVTRANLLAAELAAAAPRNPYYVTTHVLALHKQGKHAEALARLETLGEVNLTEPVRQLYRALCLAGLGQAGPAADQMNRVRLKDLLPEEKRLAEAGRTEIARLERVQGNRTRLLAFQAGQEPSSGAAGWLVLVGDETRGSANTDMQLADSLYAAPDWPGLRELLQPADWSEHNYLRSALLARAFRETDDLRQSQAEWRQAVARADRNPVRLQNLRALVTRWEWTPERMETLNLLFARTPKDRQMLGELREHYRTTGRTSELLRVLTLHLEGVGDTSEEAVAQAYYSLLLDTHVARAHVTARNAFEAAPADTARRMLYVFSLWKQRRAAEARPLMAEVMKGVRSDVVSIPLLRATVLVQLGEGDAARESLAEFNPATALPEEVALAEQLFGKLAEQRVAATK